MNCNKPLWFSNITSSITSVTVR